MTAACVVEDRPVDGGGGTGGISDACGGCEGDTPACDPIRETCVQCTVADDAFCEAQGQVCDEESNTCIACEIEDGCCTDSSQCTDLDASRCALDTNECAGCESNADCDGADGLPATGNACDDGTCRACTPESEDETCPSDSTCNPATYECSGEQAGSLELCENCVADSECGDEGEPSDAHRCVPMEYESDPFPGDGTGFCLKTTDGGCERPYAVTLSNRPSLSDEAASNDYCGINEALATCPAVAGLVADERCPEGTDEECRPSGICRDVGALQNRCTYRCSDVVECKDAPVPGSTCGSSGSGGDDYCGG
jgi:hypothetical protein